MALMEDLKYLLHGLLHKTFTHCYNSALRVKTVGMKYKRPENEGPTVIRLLNP